MKREDPSKKFPIGSHLPSFTLKNVDNSTWSSDQFKIVKALAVVFTCNHCPYVKGSEDELVALANRCKSEGLDVVTINSNDPIKYPDDSFQMMQKKFSDMNLPYPYLFDESQEVARTFDAACTPECYLFNHDKKLVFHGAINDSPMSPGGVRNRYLQQAIEQTLAGEAPSVPYAHPMGCSIKWR